MKKIKASIIVMVILFAGALAYAQETRIVKVEGWDPESGEDPALYENNLYYAVMNDSTERKTNPDVIFELKRDRIYYLGKQIENYDFHLHIRGEQGEGLLPEIAASAKSDGTYGLDYIKAYNDLTLENLAINGYLPDGGYQHWVVECRGNGSTVRYNNVTWDADRAAAVCARADSLSIFVTNCTMGNLGYRTAFGGNGRLIDLRPEAMYLDTLVIENTTTYHMSDRILRNMNTKINYLYINHLSALNVLGRNGGLQLGNCKNAVVKNSLFANVIMLGHTDAHNAELTQPEDPPHFAVISLDTIYEDGNYEIHNNNIFWDNSVTGVWDQIDSVSAPDFVNPLIEEAVDADMVDDIYFSEILNFDQMCGPSISYIALYYADPSAGTYPDSWCVGGDGGYFPDQIDASYSNTSDSYTAGDDGMPVGNVNHFDEFVSSRDTELDRMKQSSINAFPNPVTEQLHFEYSLNESQEIRLVIYDLTGKTIKILVDDVQSVGAHTISWDRSNQSSVTVPAGYYFYSFHSKMERECGKIIVVD